MIKFGVFTEQLRNLLGDVDAGDRAVEFALLPNSSDHRDLLALQLFGDNGRALIERLLLDCLPDSTGFGASKMGLLGGSG